MTEAIEVEARSDESLDASVWWPLIREHLPLESSDSAPCRGRSPRGRAVETRIVRLLRGLHVSGLTAFEFPLGAPWVVPDISQRVDNPSAARWLARRSPARARRLLLAWARAREGAETPSSLGRMPSLWLEYDLGRSAEPAPLLCVRLPPECGGLAPWVDAAFGDIERGVGWRRTLDRCRTELPAGARPLYLFDLDARRPGLTRLEIFGLPAASVVGYLGALGVDPPRQFAVEVAPLAAGERPHLSFDIGPDGEISDRIGFETSFERLPSREPGWRRLLEGLVAADLCTETNLHAFLSWQGQDYRRTVGARWPSEPALARGVVARVVSHVKLVFEGDSRPIAKGYLLFQHVVRRPSPEVAGPIAESRTI